MGFASFMATGFGRGLRIVAGLALLVIGLLIVKGIWGVLIAIVALVPCSPVSSMSASSRHSFARRSRAGRSVVAAVRSPPDTPQRPSEEGTVHAVVGGPSPCRPPRTHNGMLDDLLS